MANDKDMKDCVQRYKRLVSETLDNLIILMLAIGSRHGCLAKSRGWLLGFVSNDEARSRQRLVDILTHPSAVPLYLQYRLGQPQ
ncbi:hypothetical protein FPOAC2_01617 [Fusarium poae]|jgi:hypothetical protein